MELERLRKILNEREEVNDVKIMDLQTYMGKVYSLIFECKLHISDEFIPILIGIPANWSRELIDIYLKNVMEFPFIPHVDTKGKVCLFDLEGILIDQNLEGILLQSLCRVEEIIDEGCKGENLLDFIEEFDLYWCQLPHVKQVKLKVSNINNNQIIKYTVKDIKRRNKENYSKYLLRKQKSPIYIFDETSELKKYNIEKPIIKNGMLIHISPKDFLFPPDARYELDVDYIEKLLEQINIGTVNKGFSKLGKDKMLLFNIEQPNGLYTYLGVLLNDCTLLLENNKYKIKSVSQIIPIDIRRIDKEYLMTRSNNVENLLQNKKILLIGCGSLGGYIADELVKAGLENLMLVDDDLLHEENIFRHLLGMEYVDKYKCVALQDFLSKNIPNVYIKSLSEGIEEAIIEEYININQYDLVISAVGNHNVNRWINEFFITNRVEVPVIYAWNEVLGIGNHVSFIKYGNNGCYECFIGRDGDTGEIYDRNSYCQSGQIIVKKISGCGSSFIPYGSIISLKTSCMCIDTVKKVFENRYKDNVIISSKGDNYYFKKAGLLVSEKYLKQKTDTVEYYGKQFNNNKCSICG